MSHIKIQLISDIHLEYRDGKIPKEMTLTDADILILAGDIGLAHLPIYREFLEFCTENYPHVIMITGNHEYYNRKGVDIIDKRIRDICLEIGSKNGKQNLHFLQRNHVDLFGIRVLGCTLWTEIPYDVRFAVKEGMNDYRRIKKKIKVERSISKRNENGEVISKLVEEKRTVNITPNDVNNWHNRDKVWLNNQIENSDLPIVIVTHHAPTFQGSISDEHNKGALFEEEIKYAYATNLEDLMLHNKDKIKLWCYGHTHKANQVDIHNVRVWSNPLGYPSENQEYVRYGESNVFIIDKKLL